jgi:hypothetical protein
LGHLSFVEGTWGFTATRARVCLLARVAEAQRPLVDALAECWAL